MSMETDAATPTNETMKDGERAALTDQQIYDKFYFLEGLVSELTYRQIADTAIEIARAASPQSGEKGGQWIERWHGSEPFRGWSIFAGRERIAFIGGDESLSEAVSEIVEAHNRVAAPQAALTDEQIMCIVRPHLDDADGGYICDFAAQSVVAAVRAVLANH